MVSHCRVVKTAIRAMGCQVNRHGYLAHRPSSTDHKHPRKRRTQHTIASLSDSLRFCYAVFSTQGSHERDIRVSSLVMVFELSLCGHVFSAVSSPNIRFAAGATVRCLSCGPTSVTGRGAYRILSPGSTSSAPVVSRSSHQIWTVIRFLPD